MIKVKCNITELGYDKYVWPTELQVLPSIGHMVSTKVGYARLYVTEIVHKDRIIELTLSKDKPN